jgi:hypothetical protein
MELRLRQRLLIALVLWASLAGSAAADPNCKCRYFGERYELGTLMCIRGKLSRCEMVLNNTSWKTIADYCPQASLPQSQDAAPYTAINASAQPRLVAASR